MLTADGPRVLEFNCRFGDPETQSILPLVEGDLLGARRAAGGALDTELAVCAAAAVTVVLAAGDYPERSDGGTPIDGIEEAETAGALVFHAGTALHDGRVVTNGGRILNVTALGDDLAAARSAAYDAASRSRSPGCVTAGTSGSRPPRAMSGSDGPLVGILVGSDSDRDRMQPALDELASRGITYELEVRSAHRTPARRRRLRAHGARAWDQGADRRRRPRRRAARRRRRAHRPAGDRGAAALVEERARRARRAALDRPDAAGRARGHGRRRQRARTQRSWRPGFSRSDRAIPTGPRLEAGVPRRPLESQQ